MKYGYRCRYCGDTKDHSQSPSEPIPTELGLCTGCLFGHWTRDFSTVSLHRPMQEHFNQTLQRPISDMGQFKRILHDRGEQYTDETGMPTNYQPVDIHDTKSLGVTEEGLDTTNRKRVDLGLPAVKVP